MSSAEGAVSYPSRRGVIEGTAVWEFIARYTPKQGWDTVAILAAALGVVVWTVKAADWVDTPGMLALIVAAALAGLGLAKVRMAWPLTLLAGLAIGFLILVWQAAALTASQPLLDRLREAWARLGDWWEAAVTGGISTDLLPFTLILLTMAWLLGFLSAFFLFRFGNVWPALVLTAVAIFTNLSFLPEYFTTRLLFFDVRIDVIFILFMFLAMLLMARISLLQRQDEWKSAGISYSATSVGLAARATAGLSLVILLAAMIVPMRVVVASVAVDLWNLGRSPVSGLEDEFARLFSGIVSRKNLSGRFFGRTLPFQGKISLGGDIVMWANSERPTYWLSRTYSEYTSEGWIAGMTRSQDVVPDVAPPPPQESLQRVPMLQNIQLLFDSDDLLTGGNVEWISRDAEVQILLPLSFDISMRSASRDWILPEEIQGLAKEMRDTVGLSASRFVESDIARMLPEDLRLVEIVREGGGRLGEVTLARKPPTVPDVVSWKFAERFDANDSYAVRTLVSDATNFDLLSAGPNYSGFIKDHYLQLPQSVPGRIGELAADLTADAETPVEKALAIQKYLRSEEYVYSQDIEKPPEGQDGVDYFLFETKTGYSDYFASAMAVMLRTVGVPARLAAGYAPGETENLEGRRAVRDSDSHGWVQVYFPAHGWMDFEPTAKWPVTGRGSLEAPGRQDASEVPSLEDFASSGAQDNQMSIECLEAEMRGDFFLMLEECGEIGAPEPEVAASGAAPPPPTESSLPGFLLPLAIVLAAVGALWLTAVYIWRRDLANATVAEATYTKLSRFGTFAGIKRQPHETPYDYAFALGNAVPAVAIGAMGIADVFSAGRYGRQDTSDEVTEELTAAWKGIRGTLLGRAFRRLIPL